jgi:hypothetical protein
LVILHAFLALVSGFAVMILLVVAMTALLARVAPSWKDTESEPPLGYVFVNLGYTFLAAAAGGYATSWVAAGNPLIHVLALALVVLAVAALSALQLRGKQPVWYQLTMVAISPIGVLAGGLLRLRILGIL